MSIPDKEEEQAQDEEELSALDQFDDLPPSIAAERALASSRKYVAYTVKLPSEQLAALQMIWLELKKMYGAHSPDKSGIIQLAITEWLKQWDGPEKQQMLRQLLQIREQTRKRQYKKD
ncbi:MAG: hypothetical protein K2W95_11710 [Candidatus Obscuribacterales bacterium]|nr:hypothetical protein [Candidatus Obscuribacterales bacterium]